MEEVLAHVEGKMDALNTTNWQLRLMAQDALETGLKKLKELANDEARIGQHFESTDLKAAQSLAKFALEAIKLTKIDGVRGKGNGQADLFDTAESTGPMGPWDLKKGGK
jgi:hypothetical protein